ncbi:MAG TPA: Crp/Fnr family transcriptional regulator [Pyrinomonadaceae bacterium]|nr:Crp/Fnr family transcriptional regulator [Pyrinomonadaceae bacterium]
MTGNEGAKIPKQRTSTRDSNNSVLSRLSTAEYKRVEPHLERVPLTFGETIYKSKAKIDHIYFPDNGVISIVGITANEKPIEVGLIGVEGFVGLPVFLGVPQSGNHVIVQGEGTAQRISAKAALAEFTRFETFHDAVLLFAHELFLQLSQITSCNRYHAVEQRLSRWLLMMRDRVDDDTLPLTQEFLSWMLGVRNQAVSLAAKGLQDQGAIKYSRGLLTILNRRMLEKKACPCYRMIKMRSNGGSSAGTAPA